MQPIENKHFSLVINPSDTTWMLKSKSNGDCQITAAFPDIIYSNPTGKQTITIPSGIEFTSSMERLDGLGECQVLKASCIPESDSVGFQVELALPVESPLFLIRTTFINQTSQIIQQEQFHLLKSKTVDLSMDSQKNSDLGCYVNGWQSWSYSGTYASDQKAVISHLGAFQVPKLYDAATPIVSKAGLYTSDMFGALLNRTHRTGILAGYLSQVEHFGHIRMTTKNEISLAALAAGDSAEVLPGTKVTTDWLAITFLDLNDPDPLAVYLNAAARVNHVTIREKIPAGWCSWYHYYTRIKPQVIRNNLYDLAEIRDLLPVDLVQIDDGFEKSIGDWLETHRYFDGEMDLLAEDIKEENYTPGLWLAPFIVSPSSQVYKDHPDWMTRMPNGKPANAGWNWEKFCGGLDLSHPDAKEYVRQVIINAVSKWGYPYLKLDFLYAGALQGKRYDSTLTRAKVLRQAMELIREAAGPEAYILGCGAPLGSMLGIVDGMRIGTDVAPDWEPKYMGIEYLFPNDPDIPSAKNAMQNTISRSALHMRWWQNDPDCLLLRPSTKLTLAEVQTMASIIELSGGLLLLSDDMHEVSRYRLKIAQAMLPLIGKRPRVIDWADRLTPRLQRQDMAGPQGQWHLLSYTNWGEKPVLVDLDLARYELPVDRTWAVREYWTGENYLVDDGHLEIPVPPHGTALLSVYPFTPDVPVYLGSDLHLSQGMEVSGWEVGSDTLTMKLALNHQAEGVMDLYLPEVPVSIWGGDEEINFAVLDGNIYRLNILFDREELITIKFQG